MTQARSDEATFPASLTPLTDRVARRIVELLDAEHARWTAIDRDLAGPIDALRTFITAGGKRLRPAFCFCAYVGAGGDAEDPAVVDASAALELVHTFALVHDDVMDGSTTRRGSDAIHRRFVRDHDTAAWRGEARRFGEGMAILVGDFAVVYADLLMRAAPRTALDIYDELRIELCVGQSLDLMGTASASTDPALAHRIATFKSGKYTVERPLHLGAALAHRFEELSGPLTDIGIPLGRAFQLRDDVLGAFGDASVTGKPVGDDLREGKPTPMIASAYARAGDDDRRTLARLGAPDLAGDDIAALQEVLIRTGALDDTEAAIARLVADARDALERAPLVDTARAWLDELATYVAWRDR